MIFIGNSPKELSSLITDHNIEQFKYTVIRSGKGIIEAPDNTYFCWFFEIQFND